MSQGKSRAAKNKATKNDDINDNENVHYITADQLENILDENRKKTEKTIKDAIKSELSALKQEVIRLQSEIESAAGAAENATKLSEQLKKDFTKLQEENAGLKTKMQNIANQQNVVLETIEDRTNRQLRKTLVFKGVPEEKISTADGPPRAENWSDTATVLARAMSAVIPNTTVEEARSMVERCHRAAPSPNYKGTGPRPIFAAYVDWRDSELTKDEFRKNTDGSIYVEQKVGPLTTLRRNIALKERKRLLEAKTILSGYVSFPARLMVKDSDARGAKYRQWRDFSKEPVTFSR